MKDQYVGDINDFRKYALLRALAGAGLGIGVCWMLTPPDGRSDGRMVEYLDRPDVWRAYDPGLFDLLRATVGLADGRRIAVLEESGVVPGAAYANALVPDDLIGRGAFMRSAAKALAGADVVFFDPDNGLDVPSIGKGRRGSSKYVYRDEIAATYDAGHSVLVYQHFPRVERARFIAQTAAALSALAPGSSVWLFRTAHVAFFLICHPRHATRVDEAIAGAGRAWDGRFVQVECLSTPSPSEQAA